MKVVIVGTGSTAQEIASILISDRNFSISGFVDKDPSVKGKKILGIEVIGSHEILKDLFNQGIRGAVVAVGFDNNLREKYFHRLETIGFEMLRVIHSSALIDANAHLDEGVVIGPGCIISPHVRIDRNTILEAGVIIGSHAMVADNVSIGVGACIGGGVTIKRNAFLSTGCSVGPHLMIGKNVTIGPGVSVTTDLPDVVREEA